MTTNINATVTVARTRLTPDQLDTAIDLLTPHGGAVFRDSTGRFAATITVPAKNLAAGTITACSLIGEALDADPVSIEAMPDEEFHDRAASEYALWRAPDLLTVEQAATELGVTRQAVLKRIQSKSLPAQSIWNKWVIPRAAITHSTQKRAKVKQNT